MKLERLGDLTSELSSNLVKSIVLPAGLLDWLSRPRLRDKGKQAKTGEGSTETQRSPVASGPSVIVGGGPVPDEAIVSIIHLAGGRASRLAVIPVAADDPAEAAAEALRLFTRFGMRKAQVLDLTSQEQANSPTFAEKVASFDAVFLCGDNVELGLNRLKGTATADVLANMLVAGKPVTGTDAGAVILGDSVITEKDGQETVTEGLGLIAGVMVERRFSQESKFPRLVKALHSDHASALWGVGLDAGAVMAIRDGEAKALGENSVTLMDPRESTQARENATGSMCGLKVHVLMDGFGMNLRTGRPLDTNRESQQVAGGR